MSGSSTLADASDDGPLLVEGATGAEPVTATDDDATGTAGVDEGSGSNSPNDSNAAINSAETVAKSSSASPAAAAAEALATDAFATGAPVARTGSVAVPRISGAISASGPSSGSNGSGSNVAAGFASGGIEPAEGAGISGPDSLSGSRGSRGKREAASIFRTLAMVFCNALRAGR
jgi:hypothetical protein